MALRSVLNSRVPTIIILGATGTGKTKLSIELAQKFNTEIISSDSMQVYKGLDILSAKATPRERSLVPHHLVDILEPHQTYTVVDFRNKALKIIDNLIENVKMPIVVGGTNYYMESIIWNILIERLNDSELLLWEEDEKKRKKRLLDNPTDEGQASKRPNIEKPRESIEATTSKEAQKSNDEKINTDKEKLQIVLDDPTDFTNEELHEKLRAVDPVMANRLHPNNRRKILRSLEVWLETGKCHSEILDAQSNFEGLLRRPDATIVLWLKCDQAVHDVRLDARVDDMIKEGLIEELLDFHERHNKQRLKDGKPADYTKGIYQSLGFRDFHEYLMLDPKNRDTTEGKRLLDLSIKSMKMATRRFSRRQNKMVLSRFAGNPRRQIPPIYSLDTTDLEKWDECVKNKAIKIIECFINGTSCEFEPIVPEIPEEKKSINANSSNYCTVCKRIIMGDHVYKIHLQSKKHKKMLKKNEILKV